MQRAFEPFQADTALLAGQRVLVVEDSPVDLARLKDWLAMAEAQPIGVDTLSGARKALAAGGWAALVLDRVLPDGDALDWLRSEHSSRDAVLSAPPCVIVSGYLDAETYRAAYNLGAVPLPKHYLLHPDVLIAAVGSAIRLWQARSASPARRR